MSVESTIQKLTRRVSPLTAGERMSLARRGVYVGQRQLALQLGVSQGYVSWMERTGFLSQPAERWVDDTWREHKDIILRGILTVVRKRARVRIRDLASRLRVEHGFLVRIERDWKELSEDDERSAKVLAAYVGLVDAPRVSKNVPGP